jgi:hypothetical protein
MRLAGSALLVLALLPALAGCARFSPWRPPRGIEVWQDPSPPRLSLREKALAYQARLAALHQMPDGVIRYRVHASQARDDYGDLPDGPFFSGLYLASQSLRFAATGEAAARREIEHTLGGMELLMAVTGRPGLLARFVGRGPSPRGTDWLPSETRPGYWWRADVSKDQLAGYASGLGVALAVLPDPALRAPAAALARALAAHLHEHELRIVDHDGRRTTYGDLRPRLAGFPIGVHALIALAVARAADTAGAGTELWATLLADGALDAAATAHWRAPGNTKRVNQNMAYVALLALLRLEADAARAGALRAVEARLWESVAGEQNAFFAFVHAAASGDPAARAEGVAALHDFPDRKRDFPVDLTQNGFEFERSPWNSSKGEPRARAPLPLYLRPAGSNLWVSDPRLLVGALHKRGETEYAGIDYLLAYWLARERGFVDEHE